MTSSRGFAWTYLRGEEYTRPAVVDSLSRQGGVVDVLPAYDSTMVEYDASTVTAERLCEAAEAAGGESGSVPPRTVEIPVRYGGADGPDLDRVASSAGLTSRAAAALHAEAEYRVMAVGFAPGFPFLTGVPIALQTPRLDEPRRSVPAHSVGVAGHQTGIYPVETPGGWNLIGRALLSVYDPHREEPFALHAGDVVRFRTARRGDPRHPPPAPAPLSLLPPEPADPVFAVLRPGPSDLVVDAGRFGVGRFGLARSGALDAPAARLANQLVGNPPDAPVLEMSLVGPVLSVLNDALVAVTGPALVPMGAGADLPTHEGVPLRAGTELAFRPTGAGARSYLAVSGGIDSLRFFGSASTDVRGLLGRALAAGDVIGRGSRMTGVPGRRFLARSRLELRAPDGVLTVRLSPGPQYQPGAWNALLSGTFTVTAAGRVGLRLGGPHVPGGEVTSEGVPIGSVQVPPGGSPILLLNDRGTLGGYAKPAVAHPGDLPLLAQVREGDRLRFVASGRV